MGRKASSNSKLRGRGRGRGKAKVVCYEEEEEDQISQLPDSVLSEILSILPTKDTVRTSVLSKRWRFIWTFVPCIDIQEKNSLLCKTRKQKLSFMNFVDRVLRLNQVSSLRKCCLSCCEHYDSTRVKEWVRIMIMRDIEKLDLASLNLIQLPPSLFTCKKLVILKLSNKIALNVPPLVYLPSLKTLRLNYLESIGDDSVKNLLAGCPVIEELEMCRVCDEINTLYVQSSSLKSLKVVVDFDYADDTSRFVVDATNLERLDLRIYVPEQFDVNCLSSLVRVNLDLWHPDIEPIRRDVYGNTTVGLLRKMSNTKHLHLSIEVMDYLGYALLDNLPMFHNLTHLEVDIYYCGWPIVPYLLECSPNLCSFVLYKETFCWEERECHQQFHTPKCLMAYLEKIEIKEVVECDLEMEMISYFLKNSPVLKKMSIRYHELLSLNQKSDIRDKIFALPKGSADFEIEFIERTSRGAMWSSTIYNLQGCFWTPLLL